MEKQVVLFEMPERGIRLIFDRLMDEHVEFTTKTFPRATAAGALLHMQRELEEIQMDLDNRVQNDHLAEECADALGCYIDFCNRIGITPQMLNRAFDMKLQKNKHRKWKDNGDGSYSHIKGESAIVKFTFLTSTK